MHELALFAGGGGSLLAGILLGWTPVCAVEIDPYCRNILLARQRDGWLPRFPIWDDVRTFQGEPWRGYVDVVSGGFPCQDISDAGKRAGISGARSGLWTEFARILGEVRPRYAFIENTAALAHRGLDRVLADLATMGMDARWCCLGADDVGAPHRRKRLWILAYDQSVRLERQPISAQRQVSVGHPQRCSQEIPNTPHEQVGCPLQSRQDGDMGHADRKGLAVWQGIAKDHGAQCAPSERAMWWDIEPDVCRVAPRMAAHVDRITAIGNGWVPAVAVAAWRLLISHGTGQPQDCSLKHSHV